MNQIDTCRNCGGGDLRWVKDAGWVTGTWRYLRCKRCGDAVRTVVPVWTWALYAIAAGAAVWGWVVVFQLAPAPV